MGSIRIAVRSPLFRMLTLLVMLQGASLEGLDDLILQYLQMRVGFGPRDQSMVLVIMGACGIFNQIVLLPFITRYTSGEARTIARAAAGERLLLTKGVFQCEDSLLASLSPPQNNQFSSWGSWAQPFTWPSYLPRRPA